MSKLKEEQKEYLKSLTSKTHREKVKKAFKKSNEDTEVLNSIKILRKFFKSISPK